MLDSAGIDVAFVIDRSVGFRAMPHGSVLPGTVDT
jgi:hypothetical protein